jgi:hypothetical protein
MHCATYFTLKLESEARSYYVQGIDSTNSKTGETFYGVEVKDEQDSLAKTHQAKARG